MPLSSNFMQNRSWWMYPQKPIRINDAVFRNLDPDDYSIEPKHDGHRTITIIGENHVNIWTREKRRIDTPDYLVKQLKQLSLPAGTVLDGEIWSPIQRGGWTKIKNKECHITYWDIIKKGNENLSNNSIEDRRKVLSDLIKPCENIHMVEIMELSLKNLETLHKLAVDTRKEARSGFIHGIVAKRNGSIRRDHAVRSNTHPDWLKMCFSKMKGWEPR